MFKRVVEVTVVIVMIGPGYIDRVLIPTHVTDEFNDFSLPLFPGSFSALLLVLVVHQSELK